MQLLDGSRELFDIERPPSIRVDLAEKGINVLDVLPIKNLARMLAKVHLGDLTHHPFGIGRPGLDQIRDFDLQLLQGLS